MIEMTPASADDRVLLLAPTRRDGATTAGLLRENGITVEACGQFAHLLHEMDRGVAVVILPE